MKKIGRDPRWDRSAVILFGLVVLALFFYEVKRAVRVSLTFDEAATYLTYLSSNVFSIFDLRSANNHFLYSLLARLASFLGGSSELVLRLPSLLGYGLYLFFSWAILNRFFGRFFALAGFLLLNLNPYTLDFFSLGRGYGLALGCEMGALYFFLRFLDERRGPGGDGERTLAKASLLAFGAALANLSFLNVLMALWIFVLLYFLVRNLVSRPGPAGPPAPLPSGSSRRRRILVVTGLAAAFNLVVIGQCIRLSERFIEPVSVRVDGLDKIECRDVLVSGVDTYDNEVPLFPQDGVWAPPRSIYLKHLNLSLPVSSLSRLRAVTIEVGPRRFVFAHAELKKWRRLIKDDLQLFLIDFSAERRGSVFRDMNAMMNWRGDGAFFRAFGREAALVLVVFALFLGLMYGIGRAAVRWRVLRITELRPVRDSVCLAALFLFYPIYAMRVNDAFYYGGLDGFIRDTFYSLIADSFYGVRWGARQEPIVLALILVSAWLSLLLLRRRTWRDGFPDHPEAFSILALMTIISLLVIGQRAVFGIPHLMGRTAIFYIPLATLFVLFFLSDLGRFRGGFRPAAALLVTAIVALSVYHWSRTANFNRTMDWSTDAETKTMIRELTSLRDKELHDKPKVRLGVDSLFWPSSVYYRKREQVPWLEINMLPNPRASDLYYLSEEEGKLRSIIVKRYPLTGSVLAR